jgi:hypothetical protein
LYTPLSNPLRGIHGVYNPIGVISSWTEETWRSILKHIYCRWRDWVFLRGGWDHINRFSSATLHACSKQWHGFPTLYVATLSMFNEVWWEVNACFVDIVGSIHNYCLNVILQLQLMVELESITLMLRVRGVLDITLCDKVCQ